jgi:hypothetical protein
LYAPRKFAFPVGARAREGHARVAASGARERGDGFAGAAAAAGGFTLEEGLFEGVDVV